MEVWLFVYFCLFTFVGTLRGHLCDSTAFLFHSPSMKSQCFPMGQTIHRSVPFHEGNCTASNAWPYGSIPISISDGQFWWSSLLYMCNYVWPLSHTCRSNIYICMTNESYLLGQYSCWVISAGVIFTCAWHWIIPVRKVFTLSHTCWSSIRTCMATASYQQW